MNIENKGEPLKNKNNKIKNKNNKIKNKNNKIKNKNKNNNTKSQSKCDIMNENKENKEYIENKENNQIIQNVVKNEQIEFRSSNYQLFPSICELNSSNCQTSINTKVNNGNSCTIKNKSIYPYEQIFIHPNEYNPFKRQNKRLNVFIKLSEGYSFNQRKRLAIFTQLSEY